MFTGFVVDMDMFYRWLYSKQIPLALGSLRNLHQHATCFSTEKYLFSKRYTWIVVNTLTLFILKIY